MNYLLIASAVIAFLAIVAGFFGQWVGAVALGLIAIAALVVGGANWLVGSGINPFK